MSGVQLTLFDIIAIVVVLLSALAALMRGFVREVLGLASWLGAAIVAFLALPYVAPLVRPVIAGEALANGVAAVAVFLVALVALKMLSGDGGQRGRGQRRRPARQGAGPRLRRGPRRVRRLCGLSCRRLPDQTGPAAPAGCATPTLVGPVQEGARPDRGAAAGGLPAAPTRDAAPATAGGQGYTDAERQALEKLVSPQP